MYTSAASPSSGNHQRGPEPAMHADLWAFLWVRTSYSSICRHKARPFLESISSLPASSSVLCSPAAERIGRGGCLPLLAWRWGSASCVKAVAGVAVVGGGQGQDLQTPLPLRDLLHKAVQLAEAARLHEAHHTDLHSSQPACPACSAC